MDSNQTGLNDHRKGRLGLLFYPLYAIAARVLIHADVRFIDAHTWLIEAVGHLAMNFDTYLKDQILSHRKVIPVFLCGGRKPANEALLAHWSQHIRVIRNRWINWLLRPLMTFPELVCYSIPAYSIVHRGACRNDYEVMSRWADRAPLLIVCPRPRLRGAKRSCACWEFRKALGSSAFIRAKAAVILPTIGRIRSGTRVSWIMRRRCARSWRAAVGVSASAMQPCSPFHRRPASSITPSRH